MLKLQTYQKIKLNSLNVLVSLILALMVSGCASTQPKPKTKVIQDIPIIPRHYLQTGQPPAAPIEPQGPVTIGDSLSHRHTLQNYADELVIWACSNIYLKREIVRFASIGQQTVEIPQLCIREEFKN